MVSISARGTRSDGLGADWSDAFSNLFNKAADIYTARNAQKQLEAQQRLALAQPVPMQILNQTPGGSMGILVGIGVLVVAFALLSGHRR